MKEEIIKNYMAGINFNGDWSYKKIEEDLQKMLGERPALDVKYKKDVFVNEITGASKEINALYKITIAYTDIDISINKIIPKKLEILI